MKKSQLREIVLEIITQNNPAVPGQQQVPGKSAVKVAPDVKRADTFIDKNTSVSKALQAINTAPEVTQQLGNLVKDLGITPPDIKVPGKTPMPASMLMAAFRKALGNIAWK